MGTLSKFKSFRLKRVFSIKNADFSLCVLPLPDVLASPSEKLKVTVPPAIRGLVTPNTYFLINKIDLVPGLSAKNCIQIQHGESGISCEGSHVWLASLVTGKGTTEFIEGLAGALKTQ